MVPKTVSCWKATLKNNCSKLFNQTSENFQNYKILGRYPWFLCGKKFHKTVWFVPRICRKNFQNLPIRVKCDQSRPNGWTRPRNGLRNRPEKNQKRPQRLNQDARSPSILMKFKVRWSSPKNFWFSGWPFLTPCQKPYVMKIRNIPVTAKIGFNCKVYCALLSSGFNFVPGPDVDRKSPGNGHKKWLETICSPISYRHRSYCI